MILSLSMKIKTRFFIEQGVLKGIARRWVRDVKIFVDEYDIIYNR